MVQGQRRGGVEEENLGQGGKLEPWGGNSVSESPGVLVTCRFLGPTSGLQDPTLGLGQGICIFTRLPSELPVDRQHRHYPGGG